MKTKTVTALPGILPVSIPVIIMAAVILMLLAQVMRAQEVLVIRAGETQSGNVSSRLGEEWTFQGCAGDVVTITTASEDFVPFLALFDSASAEALVEVEGAEAEGEASSAVIADFALPSSDRFTLLVAGSTVRDRGPYELTLEAVASVDLGEIEAPQIFPGQRVTGEVTSRFGTEIILAGCEGDVVSFALESEAFSPHLELFGPTGRDPLIQSTDSASAGSESADTGATAQIANFTLPETGLYTLIAAGLSFRDRGPFTLTMLDVGASPPTATPVPPTPTPQPSVLNPQGIPIQVNGGDGDLMGEIFMNPSYMVSAFEEGDTIVVGELFYLELFVFDIRVGLYDGAGIDYVEYVIDCPNGEQYTRIEQSPRYCSFSDNGGSCHVLRMRSGTYFPGSSCEIVNDYYTVNVTAYPINPNLRPGNWNFYIRPEIP